jgi:glycosyltransferase involved in cell wall biosynthesis
VNDATHILDVSRLVSRRDRAAPTGIDRVELAEVRNLLGASEGLFLATRGSRSHFVAPEEIEALTAHLDLKWQSGSEEGLISARHLCGFLGAELPADLPTPANATPPRITRPGPFGRKRPTQPRGQLTYRNVSHHHLEKADFLSFLKESWRARIEIYWHDAIPILFPEYSREGDAAKHAMRLRNVLRFADAIDVNSEATADELRQLAKTYGDQIPPLRTLPLQPGLPPALPLKASRPYFITVGTIEPRKNHRMLLEVWRWMAREFGDSTPALVIAGRRGWMNEDTFALLDRSPPLQRHVVEAPELPDRMLASAIAGAQALLMPSFAEGFGLPVAEAAMLGTRVVASDLRVFREIGSGRIDFLPPEAGGRWRERIVELSALRHS